jgi:hypothetical protein
MAFHIILTQWALGKGFGRTKFQHFFYRRALLVRKKRGASAVPVSEDQNTSNKAECSKVTARSKDPGMQHMHACM